MNQQTNNYVLIFLSTFIFLFGISPIVAEGVSLDSGSDSSLKQDQGLNQGKTLSPTEVKTQVKSVFEAFKNGNMRAAIAGLLALLIWAWRKYFSTFIMNKLTDFQIGVLVALVGMLGTIPEALAATPFNWDAFLISAFVSSSEAMFFWQVVLKNIPGFGIVTPKPKTGV